MNFLEWASEIDPKKEYTIYFNKASLAYTLYGECVLGRLVVPKLSENSPELQSKYILIQIEAEKRTDCNQKLNSDQFLRLKDHGVLYHNIDFDKTLAVL